MHFLMVGAALGAVIGLTVKGAIDEEKYRRNIASLIGVQSKKNKVLQDYITIAEELSYISKENRARLASEMLLMGASVDSIMKYGPQLEKLGISVGKTTEDVITAVRSSITGIHRPFKNLGIVIEETDVKGKVEEIRNAHEGWTEEALRTEAIMLLAYPQMTRVIGDFDVAMDSAYGDTIKFKETLSDLSGDIGSIFIPLLRAGIMPLTKFMGILKEHPLLRMATAVSLLSGLVLTLAGLAIPMIVSALSFFVPASIAAAFAIGGLTAALSTLMAVALPIVAAIAAIAAVAIVFQHAYKRNLFGFADAIKKVAAGVKVAFGTIVKIFKALISGFIAPFKAVFGPVLKMFGLFNKTGKESSFLITVVDAIGGAFKRLYAFLEPHFPLIKKIFKVIGALGAVLVLLPLLPMIIGIRILVSAVKALVGGIKWLIEMFRSASESGSKIVKVMKILKFALLPLLGPIGALIMLFKHWDRIKEVINGVATSIKTKLGDAIGNITKNLEPIRRFLLLLLGPIGAIYMAFRNWGRIKAIVGEFASAIKEKLGSAANEAKGKIEALTDALAKTKTRGVIIDIVTKLKTGDIKGILKDILKLPHAYIDDITKGFENITNRIGEVFGVENLGAKITEGIKGIKDKIKENIEGLTSIFGEIKTGEIAIDIATKIRKGDMVGALKDLVRMPDAYALDIAKGFSMITNKIGAIFGVSDLSEKITSWGSDILEGVKHKFGDIGEAIQKGKARMGGLLLKTKAYEAIIGIRAKLRKGDIIGAVKDIPELIQGELKDVTKLFENVVNRIGKLFGIENLGTKITTEISEVIDRIKSFFADLSDMFYDAGMNLIRAFMHGIKSMAMAPVDAVKEIGERIREFLPFSDSRLGALRDLTASGGKLVSTFTEGMLQLKPELSLKMEELFKGVPVIGEGISKLMPAPAEMISSTSTSITNASHSEDKRISIGKIELHIDGVSNNAEEIGDTVIRRIKREFEKYGI